MLPQKAHQLSGAPLFRVGEVALYELRFRGVTIANVELAIGSTAVRGNEEVVGARCRANGTGAVEVAVSGNWEMTAEIPTSSSPNQFRKAREVWQVSYVGGSAEDDNELELHNNRHHAISALLAIRRWAPRVGESASMNIALLGKFQLTMLATEELKPGIFRRPSVRVVGRARGHGKEFPFDMWVSTDGARIPLLVRAVTTWGKAELELLGYKAPT